MLDAAVKLYKVDLGNQTFISFERLIIGFWESLAF